MNSDSSSPPDISSLSLSPHRLAPRATDGFDLDAARQYHYQTSPPVMPTQNPYANPMPANLPNTPIKPSKPTRAGLPSQWLDNQPPSLNESRSLSPYHQSDLSSGGGSPPPHPINGLANQSFPSPSGALDDDIIPNAIVIKNIPFNVKRETLLDIITSLNIPTPYAFNYHLDQSGAFRGLAFANFRAAEDADAVVAALNGFDVQGRKLRVEYKKVLQAGEKERIEREKALRRMRSMQLEKQGIGHQQQPAQGQFDDFATTPGGSLYSPQQAIGAPGLQAPGFPVHQSHTPPPMPVPQHFSPVQQQQQVQPVTPKQSASTELDMNDAATLEIYSRILLFKDDHMRDELAFSRTLSPKQRRVVHLIAQRLGVYHYSIGEGEERYAVVTRIDPEARRVPQRHTSQTLSRASSSYLQSAMQNQNQGLNSNSALRSKKSMPDMKTLHAPAPRLNVRASNSNLREGYATIASPSRRQAGLGSLFGNRGGVFANQEPGIPPVPSLPTLPSVLSQPGGLNESAIGSIVRQPRGPGEGGFGKRRTSVMASDNGPPPGFEARTHEPLEI